MYHGMMWLCKTATRSGNEKRQREAAIEAATRNGKLKGEQDHVGFGGTLANLRGYIEVNGGRVIGMTTETE
ncbi:MAG: hypothetical protein WAN11_14865 [Syntrophobacteraceae bacterium]